MCTRRKGYGQELKNVYRKNRIKTGSKKCVQDVKNEYKKKRI